MRIGLRILFSIAGGIAAGIFHWLVMGETSPLHRYFLWHTGIPNLWAMMNLVPFIVSSVVAGNPHSQSEVVNGIALFIQWFLITYLACTLIDKIRRLGVRTASR